MGFYEEAAFELKNDRRDDLWYYCLTRTEMDQKKATALYIQSAADILQKEYEERKQQEIIADQKYKVKRQIQRERSREEAASVEIAKSSLGILSPFFWTVIAAILSVVFFGRPLIVAAEGFFSQLWRWPIAILHVFATAVAVFASLSYIRRMFISHEFKRYSEENWIGILILGIISYAYLLIVFYFS